MLHVYVSHRRGQTTSHRDPSNLPIIFVTEAKLVETDAHLKDITKDFWVDREAESRVGAR